MNKVFILDYSLITHIGNNGKEILASLECFDQTIYTSKDSIRTFPITSFNYKDFVQRLPEKRYLNRGALFSVASALSVWKRLNQEYIHLGNGSIIVGAGPNFGNFPIANSDNSKKAWILQYLPNTAASVIAKRTGICGESISLGTACSASLQALGTSFDRIKYNMSAYVLCSCGDSRLTGNGLDAYNSIGALKLTRSQYQPYHQEDFGFIPGEGGSSMIIANEEIAKKYNKTKIELIAHSSTMDCFSLTSPNPEGKGLTQAIINALRQADLSSCQIDLVLAHATGTEANDLAEKKVLKNIFGDYKPIVMTMKSIIGHLSAASGLTELCLLLSCLDKGFIPKSNFSQSSIDDFNILKKNMKLSKEKKSFTILVNSMGFGGQNSVVIIRYHLNEN